ncbi:thiopeptide-type bacteriocin biosynthesis protein [Streptomyces sp. 900116325]
MEDDWLYRRIYVETYEDTQHALNHLVGGIHKVATRVIPEGRWFFIRFVDHRGLQIRVRHRAPLEILAEFEAITDEIIRDRSRWPESLRRGYCGSVKRLYEPETVKYGGAEGVDRAERVFEEGSLLALELSARPDFWQQRFGYAATLTRLAADLLAPQARRSFLYNIAWYWCGQDAPTAPEFRRRVRLAAKKSAPAVVRRMEGITKGSDYECLERYISVLFRQMVDPRSTATPGNQPRQPANLLFHAVHMNNNRLGIKPFEEAVIAEILLDDFL